MKAAKLLFSVILFPLIAQCQDIDDFVLYDLKALDKFYSSTTYVVLDQHKESSYSLAIIEAINEFWKITPFEIIDRGKFNEYKKDKSKSFLTRDYIAGDNDLISLSLFMGGQKYMDSKGKLLANVKLKHYTATDDDFIYKLPTLVMNIQWKLNMERDQKFTDASDFANYYSKNLHILHSRKLYILNEHLTNKIGDMEKLQKYYKYDVSLVSRDVIIDAIQTQDTAVAYLSIVAPTKNWKGQTAYYRVFTAEKGETLVSYERSVSSTAPVGITGYDLKKFNK